MVTTIPVMAILIMNYKLVRKIDLKKPRRLCYKESETKVFPRMCLLCGGETIGTFIELEKHKYLPDCILVSYLKN